MSRVLKRFESVCLLLLVCFLIFSCRVRAEGRDSTTDKRPWPLEAWKNVPSYRWVNDTAPIRSLLYTNESFNGMPTEVFAFYATPGSLAGNPQLDRNLPAVVLIHGGGGTAFAEWVQLWAKRGYAAIAMDLSGRQPAAPEFDPDTQELIVVRDHRKIIRTRLPNGGPEHGHTEKFQNVGGDLSDDWQFHSVAAVMRAHSLLRNWPEIDRNKTAVTGISWGGYMTCLVASLDDRFQAAVPVYGCGFLYEGESVQKKQIDSLSQSQREDWINNYDPSAWLPQCRVPILFVNGTNDVHYPLNSYSRSYDLVPGSKQIRIEVDMRHGHPPGWEPKEIGVFIDHHLLGTEALPTFGKPVQKGSEVIVQLSSVVPIDRVQLHYTTDDGLLSGRKWQSVDAQFQADRNEVTAKLPDSATVALLSATDNRGAMVSTEVIFCK
ncbi:MAG: prolyl oligopeptidase family serine peptidase [Planctomycetaceae bacterium]|nr:prolyl oligopeptidase family serine peptidase [Planctomycetaceae bacterium]